MGYFKIGKWLRSVFFFGFCFATPGTALANEGIEQLDVLRLASSLHVYHGKMRALIPIQSGSFYKRLDSPKIKLKLLPEDTVLLSSGNARDSSQKKLLLNALGSNTEVVLENKKLQDWDIVSWTETSLPNGIVQIQILAKKPNGTKINLRALLRKP